MKTVSHVSLEYQHPMASRSGIVLTLDVVSEESVSSFDCLRGAFERWNPHSTGGHRLLEALTHCSLDQTHDS